jgi:alpha-beta hydrolase superfamily lysophospholipase
VVSTNFRMLPQAEPLEQARDVGRALAAVQSRAAGWGADGSKVVLMGHSSGGHLVMLLNAAPVLARTVGAQPWRGAVSLDNPVVDAPAHDAGALRLLRSSRSAGIRRGGNSCRRSTCSRRRRPALACRVFAPHQNLSRPAQALQRKAQRMGRVVQVHIVDLTHGP